MVPVGLRMVADVWNKQGEDQNRLATDLLASNCSDVQRLLRSLTLIRTTVEGKYQTKRSWWQVLELDVLHRFS